METSKLEQLKIEREPERESTGVGGWVIGVVVLAALAAASAWWWFSRPPVLEVSTVAARAVQGAAANTVLNASGYVTARRQATVSSKFTAQVREVLIEEGMQVEEGQVLALLDDANIRRSHELAGARLHAAETARKETEALLREARANFRRTRELVDRELASQAELDRSRAAADSLAARLERMQAEVEVAARERDVIAQQLEDTEIRAPFAGVVVAKNAQPGEMISPVSAGGGFTRTGIGTIVDMDSLEIEIDVNEAYINRVTPGQQVVATLDAYPDWQIPCEVIAIIPTADRQRATVEVRVAFDAPDPRVLPDMGVKVAFQDDAAPSEQDAGVLVPAGALREAAGQTVAWIVRDGAVERRAVRVGATRNGETLVLSGLQGGERLVQNAPAEIVEGMAVRERGQ